MIETFFETSSWKDLLQYILIFTVIFGLSPYGVYFVRSLIAWRKGVPGPTIRRRKSSPRSQINDIVEEANRHIEDASLRIFELEAELSAAQSEIERLTHESEALRERIRDIEGRQGQQDSTMSGRRPSGTDIPDDVVEALSLFWLMPTPLPAWHDVRQAYRNAVKIHHPDRGGDPEIIKKMNVSYELLKTFYNE